MNLSLIAQKIKQGDALTNAELAEGLSVYTDLADKLKELGPEFHLAWKEVFFTQRLLQGWSDNRNDPLLKKINSKKDLF